MKRRKSPCEPFAWLGAHPSACLRVIFNVFLDEDAAIYRHLLSA
ncbi:hypothetical protein [Enorma massiliensis]|nr:hypothetical protein [Enorma massiliensis]